MYELKNLDYYFSVAVFTIKTDYKSLRYLLEAD